VNYLALRVQFQLQVSKINQSKVNNKYSDSLKAHLLKALEVDTKFSEAHFQLALVYQEDKDYKAAENYFQQAIKSDSQQILEIEKHGEKLLRKFQFQNAKLLFMKVQEKKHHCARVNIELSNLYESQSKLAKAKTCLKNSIQLNPESSTAYRNLGILLLKQKSYAFSRVYIKKALDLDYSDCLTHFNLGKIMKKYKKYKDAELHFLTALDLNPKYVVCMLEIAHLHLVMKNQVEAIKYYKKAREISPDISCNDLDKVLE